VLAANILKTKSVYCIVLQCVAVCCSVFCNMLQCVAVCWKRNGRIKTEWWQPIFSKKSRCIAVCCSVLQCVTVCVAVYCSVCGSVLEKKRKGEDWVMAANILQKKSVYCSVLQCVAVCCSVLQCVTVCVAVRCSVLQRVGTETKE